ncbi:MAG TPA: hypothetical protein VF510_20880 [Ktedonobacterales bacterium]
MGPTHATNAMSAMSGSAMNTEYAQMTDALRWQQQRIIELETENRELRRQLADLRSGIGVSLIIEGCQIPLALPAASPLQNGSWISGAYPPISPAATAPTFTPVPSSSPVAPQQRAYPTYPPIQPAAHTAPAQPAQSSQRPSARNSETACAENAWLTGSTPAVKPTQPNRHQQPQPARSMPRQGNRRVEPQQPPQQPQRFTPPAWLSGEAPTVTWETEFEAAAPSHSHLPAQRHHVPQTPIGPVPEEVWRAEQRYESGKFPTLAQITGQHSAVSIPGKRKKATHTHDDDRSPFTDSFVLG